MKWCGETQDQRENRIQENWQTSFALMPHQMHNGKWVSFYVIFNFFSPTSAMRTKPSFSQHACCRELCNTFICSIRETCDGDWVTCIWKMIYSIDAKRASAGVTN